MTPLRQQMIRELELHRKPANTIKAYVSAVAQLAAHYHRSPEQISVEEIRSFIHRMITQRHWADSTCNQKLCGILFFYQQVFEQPRFNLRIPTKRSGRFPEPLSREEIRRLIEAARNRKHRVLMMTTYVGQSVPAWASGSLPTTVGHTGPCRGGRIAEHSRLDVATGDLASRLRRPRHERALEVRGPRFTNRKQR